MSYDGMGDVWRPRIKRRKSGPGRGRFILFLLVILVCVGFYLYQRAGG